MNVIVTGAAGFIGSHLSERLVGSGQSVVGIDNFDPFYDEAIKKANIKELDKTESFRLERGDIRDADFIKKVFAQTKPNMVVHLAAKAGVRPSIADPVGYMDVNVNGTAVLLDAAQKADVKKFVFASSSSVYGNNKKVPFAESDNVDFPISPYAATKKAGELLCHTFSHIYRMDISCLRFFTVYGPRQRPDLAIHKFCGLIEQGVPIPVFGDGSMMRDFTYIDDIIDGVVSAMNNLGGCRIYNLGESKPVRLDALISMLEKALDKKAIIERKPVPPGDVKQTFADIAKAEKELGYRPSFDVEKGLDIFVDWLRQQN